MAVVSPPMPAPMTAARFTIAPEKRIRQVGIEVVWERSYRSKQIVAEIDRRTARNGNWGAASKKDRCVGRWPREWLKVRKAQLIQAGRRFILRLTWSRDNRLHLKSVQL